MEIKHASPESFFRYLHCERCNNIISRHEVWYKNSYFNTAKGITEVCYNQCCLNCSNVYKRKYITKTLTTSVDKWNELVEHGYAP